MLVAGPFRVLRCILIIVFDVKRGARYIGILLPLHCALLKTANLHARINSEKWSRLFTRECVGEAGFEVHCTGQLLPRIHILALPLQQLIEHRYMFRNILDFGNELTKQHNHPGAIRWSIETSDICLLRFVFPRALPRVQVLSWLLLLLSIQNYSSCCSF
jgi:hypothetical protein